jgi:glutamate--cysteine ligase
MSSLQARLNALTPARLGASAAASKGELRALPGGGLASRRTPGAGLGAHPPSITTDYSESQVELITGAHARVETAWTSSQVHQFVYRVLRGGRRVLWVSSMPCGLPTDETIPLARYGSPTWAAPKRVPHGPGPPLWAAHADHLGHPLQLVAARREQRAVFRADPQLPPPRLLLLYLFGASPALCPCFVAGASTAAALGDSALYLPHATSLRMGRLGYQSDAQASWPSATTAWRATPTRCTRR